MGSDMAESDPGKGSPPGDSSGPRPGSSAAPVFSLDAIRDLFRDDARRLLDQMVSKLTRLEADPGDGAELREVAAHGHALMGTAAMVEFPSLSRAGAVLRIALETAASQASRNREAARSLVTATLAALDPAQRMLDDCLDRRAANQERLLSELLGMFEPAQRESLLSSVEAELAASSELPEFEEDEPAGEVAPAATSGTGEAGEAEGLEDGDSSSLDQLDPDLAASLVETFLGELKDILAEVPDLLARLLDPAEQADACADLGRVFHTVKGSAATVGMENLRTTALALEEVFEGPEDDPSLLPLRPEFFRGVAEPLMELFRAAELDPPTEALDLALQAARASSIDDDEEVPTTPSDQEGIPPQADESTAPHDDHAATSPPVEPEIMQAFAIDASEALDASETALLRLERNPQDHDQLRVLFRHFHTLKGAAAAVGCTRISHQLHAGETLLDGVLERRLVVNPNAVVELLLRLVDSVAGLIAEARGVSHTHRILDDVDDQVAQLLAVEAGQPAPEEIAADPSAAVPSALPEPVRAEPASAETAAPAGFATEADAGIVRIHASRLDLLMNRVSELVVSRTRMDDTMNLVHELKDKLNLSKLRLNETIEGFRGTSEFNANGAATAHAPAEQETRPGEFTDLEFDKYDDSNVLARTLVELAADAGEIVDQLGKLIDNLGEETRQISKVTSSLQRAITGMRLLSLETLYRRLQRPVREATRQVGNQIEMSLAGGEVQLDRSLIESLYGPLLHLVRNSVSHGIELPGERRERGKSETGRIDILAEQRHGSVAILVRDDGRGLDFGAIRAKAERLGLIPSDATASREELSQLIFRPGFSTQEQANDLAGRGVGMDVVAREVAQLRGSVSVESIDGQGATFRLTLPITAVIDQVLLLRVGAQIYGLSQGPIETVVNVEPEHLSAGNTLLHLGDAEMPALALWAIAGEPPPVGTVVAVILRSDEQRLALLVERVEAQREAVVRPLGRMFAGHALLTSATFAGDGQVIFVLDTSRLASLLGTAAAAPIRSESGEPAVKAIDEATVLWADDSISVRKLAEHFLTAEGLTARTAVDGRDALEKLRLGRYQVLVTDLEMPRMHGYELLNEIRADPHLKDLQVIVCSSRASEKHRQRAREAGANGYLTKPFTRQTLAAALRECLSAHPE